MANATAKPVALTVTKVDVWIAEIPDQPGGLAGKLQALAAAGANLEFAVARRQPDKPGTGIVFLGGLAGAAQTKAAKAVGFTKSATMAGLRVEGPNKPGVCHQIVQRVAAAGINLRGMSALGLGTKCAVLLAFDSAADATKAARAVSKPAS
jgi:hypothetical protein